MKINYNKKINDKIKNEIKRKIKIETIKKKEC